MAKFMDVHSGFFGVTAQQLKEAHDRDLEIEADEGVHFEHAWLDPDARQGLLPRHRPDQEAVIRIHARAGHPTPGGLRALDRGLTPAARGGRSVPIADPDQYGVITCATGSMRATGRSSAWSMRQTPMRRTVHREAHGLVANESWYRKGSDQCPQRSRS